MVILILKKNALTTHLCLFAKLLLVHMYNYIKTIYHIRKKSIFFNINILFLFNNVYFVVGEEKLNWESLKKLYKEILTAFDKIILPTQGCCHSQYILFYICSLKQDLCDGFLDYLWKKVQNPNVAPVFRQISAFFIGSFLSRAKYIGIR